MTTESFCYEIGKLQSSSVGSKSVFSLINWVTRLQDNKITTNWLLTILPDQLQEHLGLWFDISDLITRQGGTKIQLSE